MTQSRSKNPPMLKSSWPSTIINANSIVPNRIPKTLGGRKEIISCRNKKRNSFVLKKALSLVVFRTWIRLPDPDPLVRGSDSDLNPSTIKKRK
jgi:hypothetical protein